MKSNKELKYLKQINLLYSDPAAQLRKVRKIGWAFRIIGWLGIWPAAFIMGLYRNHPYIPFLAIFFAVLSGIFIGYAIFVRHAIVQWPWLSAHTQLNQQSIDARIAELEK